jgi:hypothetical protein
MQNDQCSCKYTTNQKKKQKQKLKYVILIHQNTHINQIKTLFNGIG